MNPLPPAPHARAAPWLWLLAALLVRALVALRTDVPGRDAASYLWMAEEAAQGTPAALFATVFAPFYPLLVALLLLALPGLDTVVAGQLVSCGAAALAVVPLHAVVARLFSAPAAHGACLVYVLGTNFARHPAECMSEGPFFLLVALALRFALNPPRPFVAGLCAGLAYATRPEGAALAGCLVLWFVRQPDARLRRTLACAGGAALGGALVPLGYATFGAGFTLTPKASFNWEVGVGSAQDASAAFYFKELLDLVGATFEGLGFVTVPLLLLGCLVAGPRRLCDAKWLILVPFLAQCAVVPLLRANERFVLGYGMAMLGFAGAGLAWLQPRVSKRAFALVLVLLVGRDLARLPERWQEERQVERELGLHLRTLLAPGETLATEMPRVEFFAGLQPGPPRPIRVPEILALAARPGTRFVAIVALRTPVPESEISAAGFAALTLPPDLARATAVRGIRTYERKKSR